MRQPAYDPRAIDPRTRGATGEIEQLWRIGVEALQEVVAEQSSRARSVRGQRAIPLDALFTLQPSSRKRRGRQLPPTVHLSHQRSIPPHPDNATRLRTPSFSMPPASQHRPSAPSARSSAKNIMPAHANGAGGNAVDPQSWLNFSLPPRRVPGSNQPGAPIGLPRRSRRGEGWRGGAMSRERYVHANFRFVLKPNETLSYGAHFADPDM